MCLNVPTPGPVGSRTEDEDRWMLDGLRGNGIAPLHHLENYMTAPHLPAATRQAVAERLIRAGRVVPVEIEGLRHPCFALPEHLDLIGRLSPPRGTRLICPFDSFLFQRKRAEELLDFRYRVEIYVPREKRVFGYYVLPILHQGQLIGRLDPKFDRRRGLLLVHAVHYESWFRPDAAFRANLQTELESLATFLGARDIRLPSERSG